MTETITEDKQTEVETYEILNPAIFRAVLKGRDDVTIEKHERGDGGTVYTISDKELIETCVDDNIIQKSRDGQAERITSPEALMKHINTIERRIYGDESEYYITTKRGTVSFTSEDIIKIGVWKRKMMEAMKYLITFPGRVKGGGGDLDDVIMYVMENAVIVSEEDQTEREMQGDIIMARLMRLPVVLAKEDYVGNKVILEEEGMYAASTTTIHEIVREVGYLGMTAAEQGKVLAPYCAKRKCQKMRDGVRRIEWFFKVWGEV